MMLREFENRFRDKNITGAIMFIQNEMYEPMVLTYFRGNNCAWFMKKNEYPSGRVKIIKILNYDLLNQNVLGWVNKSPLMENDLIYLKNNKKEKVVRIKEGNASPFPIVTNSGQYAWDEIVMIAHGLRGGV